MLLLFLCGIAVVAYLLTNLFRFRFESKELKKDLQILRHNKQIRREHPIHSKVLRMSKIKNKFVVKHKEALQRFYDQAITDPELQLMIDEVSKHPEMSTEFHKALDVLYNTMDRMCKEEIKKDLEKESKK